MSNRPSVTSARPRIGKSWLTIKNIDWKECRRLSRFEQALDHPVLQTIPETEYFRGVLFEMMPGR
jgi:hypothetical protein